MNSVLALQTQAIQAAKENRWLEAIRLNQHIVEKCSDDISALNRLGFCYLQTSSTRKAKDAYQKVLELDKYNAIAKKYLDVITTMKTKPILLPNGMFQENFIDEPGKTKTVQLCRVADPSVLNTVAIGMPCILQIKKHRIAVETEVGTMYLGSLPDDLSHHLSRLILGGNKYKAVVKAITRQSCSVFIKELSRSKKFTYTTSFPNASHHSGDMHEELLIDQSPLDLSETGEEDSAADEISPSDE